MATKITIAMRSALLTVFWAPGDSRKIVCNQKTGDSLVSRGLAHKHTVGTRVHYCLTDAGRQKAVLLMTRDND